MIIELPFKTPTINHLYYHRGSFKVLTKEARELRNEIVSIVQSSINKDELNELEDKELSVIVEVYEDWYCVDGSIKKKDIANREKFLIDSVFLGLEIDDKQIFESKFIKKQANKEKSIIKIQEMAELGS